MRKFDWRRWPLAVKLTLLMTALVVTTAVSVTLLAIQREQQTFQAELQQQGEVLLETLELIAVDALYLGNVDALQELTKELGETQSDLVLSGRVYDSGGRLIADSTQDRTLVFRLEPDAFGQPLVESDAIVQQWYPDRLLIGKGVLVGRNMVGALSAELSTAPLQAKMDGVRNQGLLVALGAAVVGTLAALVISRSFLEPLEQLRQATQRIAGGDLNYRLRLNREDEVGQVMHAFNDMSSQLLDRDTQLAAKTTALTAEVAERKKAEAELAKMVLELHTANEKANEASRLKSEFLATMSHELRTPLNAIIGFSGIMQEGMAGRIDASARHMTKGIYDSANHLLSLINAILDISKIEAGRLQIVSAPIRIRDMAQQWQAQMDVLAKEKGLALEIETAPAVPDVLIGDQERISQIAINLMSNAVKFTDQGKVSLNLDWQENNLLIRVTDTGVGIPPHALSYIFEEFRQADGTSQRARGGTGLGLSIVQKLCRAMGGSVQVSSKLGEGSVFTATLPLQPQTVQSPHNQPQQN